MKHPLKTILGFDELILVGALLMGLGLAWNTVSAMQRNYRLQQKYDQLAAEVELLELENENIKYNIAYLKTDEYLELAAREKFDKARPGETMVYLPGSGQAAREPVIQNKQPIQQPKPTGWRANIEAWWQFFKGKGSST